jgi:hypothetical protein
VILGIAGERDLRDLSAQQTPDVLVGDVADLVVLLDHLASLVAYSAVTSRHESVTRLVFGTDVAVDARPALVAPA